MGYIWIPILFAVITIVIVASRNGVTFKSLFSKMKPRGGSPTGTGGLLKKIGWGKWIGVILVLWFALAFVSLISSCVSDIVIGVAKEAHLVGHDLAHIGEYETRSTREPIASDESVQIDEGLPIILRSTLSQWHLQHRAHPQKSGWKSMRRQVVSSPGGLGFQGPVLNTDFMEDWDIRVLPGDGWAGITNTLGNRVLLISAQKDRLLSLSIDRSEYLAPVVLDTGLIFLSVTSGFPNGGNNKFSLQIGLVEPTPVLAREKNRLRRLERRKESTYSVAYGRDCIPESLKVDESWWGDLPLFMEISDGTQARIGFDVRVRLSGLPQEGEKMMNDLLPPTVDLENTPVIVRLVGKKGSDSQVKLEEWSMIQPYLEFSSEMVRSIIESSYKANEFTDVSLFVDCSFPVRVDIAAQFRDSKYGQ